ncbi:MAG: hypothetical protein M1541_04490, partial [Acidobacteria bacterium]|nr:hypothetical protein [Acidobacteriota bacterium]
KMQTTAYDASVGHTMGAVINVSTASGGNELHGEAHYVLRHRALDAPNFFNNKNGTKLGVYQDHRQGGSIGGPLVLPHLSDGKNRTFWFYVFEDNRFGVPIQNTATVPTAAERAGEWGYNINQPMPSAALFADKPRRFPNYPSITYQSNGAGHQYNSLTLEAERRFTNGLAYQLSWVWARDIGDLERGQTAENAYDRTRERSVWLDIPTHRVTGNLIYELPLGRGARGMKGALLKGWEWTSVYSLYSGQFLTPQWTGPDPTGTAYTSSRTPASVTIRPNQLRNANLPEAQRSSARWFDVSAFAPPTAGWFGTAAKGVIKGPGSAIVDAGLAKHFTITERLRLRWEMTATNFFNSTNFNNPGVNITSVAGAGVITGAGGEQGLDAGGPRSFRTGLRLEW